MDRLSTKELVLDLLINATAMNQATSSKNRTITKSHQNFFANKLRTKPQPAETVASTSQHGPSTNIHRL